MLTIKLQTFWLMDNNCVAKSAFTQNYFCDYIQIQLKIRNALSKKNNLISVFIDIVITSKAQQIQFLANLDVFH